MDKLFDIDMPLRGNHCRRLLEECRKTDLKKLAGTASSRLFGCDDDVKHWYELIIDTYKTKIYVHTNKQIKKAPKHIFPLHFHNKGLEHIKLASILHDDDVINSLPDQLADIEIPSVVHSLGGTIRNKIFNYKTTVQDIKTTDLETFGTGILTCDCNKSTFCNTDHGHVLTGDLRIIENVRLRKLISKGPNYREPRSINWRKCREKIEEGLETCAMKLLQFKKGLQEDALTSWKAKVMEKVDAKITCLSKKIKPHKTNPVLQDPAVKDYLSSMHKKYVLVPIDKAANNVAFICKKYYVQVILNEIGILGSGSPTYAKAEKNTDEIIEENCLYAKHRGFEVKEEEKTLPSMYWTPKMHKNPVGARFIIASKLCSTKQISKAVSSAFKLVYRTTENFHQNARYESNYNKFWVLQNADPVLSSLNNINRKKEPNPLLHTTSALFIRNYPITN